jgi:hypothetical protein
MAAQFVAHDSRLRFGCLNHAPGDTITRTARRVDANTLSLLPLSGAQPIWRDLLLASSRSKMTRSGHSQPQLECRKWVNFVGTQKMSGYKNSHFAGRKCHMPFNAIVNRIG